MNKNSVTPLYDRAMHLIKLRRKGAADIESMELPELVTLIASIEKSETQLCDIRHRALMGMESMQTEINSDFRAKLARTVREQK